jgi:dolichol-phosphate mannosyltransferase
VKTLVILPTYNEGRNIGEILQRVQDHGLFDVLVVDDASQDGTPGIVRKRQETYAGLHMVERPGKLGLGTAYTTGFKWGLEQGYDCMMEMDSDFSHDTNDMPRFVEAVEQGADLVIGSRYIDGKVNVVGWDFKRLLLSRFGNIYASTILRVPLTDMTSGFRAYSRRAIEAMNLDGIRSQGYAFQIEMAYYVHAQGFAVREIPIVFYERTRGSSKMSRSIVREAVKLPWKLRVAALFGDKGQRKLTNNTEKTHGG